MLSRLSQFSAVGAPGLQESAPAVQVPVAAHSPTPQLVAKPSTVPSQSSSMPLQVSADGVPGVQVCGTPPTQSSTVTSQAPIPQVV